MTNRAADVKTVVHIVDDMAGGGTQETVMCSLAHSRHPRLRHTLVQITPDNVFEKHIRDLNLPHVVVDPRPVTSMYTRLPWHLFSLFRAVRSLRPDLLVCRLPAAQLYGFVCGKLLGIPLIFGLEGHFSQYPGWYCGFVRQAAPRVDLLYAVYEDNMEELRRAGARVARYPVCMVFEQEQAVDEAFERFLAGAGKGPFLACAGRLHPDKGHQYAIKALARLRAGHPGLRLFVAGTGAYETELRELAAGLGVSDMVYFCGFVRNLRRFWSVMDVCVQGSVNEMVNRSSLWALKLGAPVVKFRLVLPEHFDLEAAQCGRFVPLDEEAAALATALSGMLEPTRLQDMGQAAVAFADALPDAQQAADAFDAMYCDVLGLTHPAGGQV